MHLHHDHYAHEHACQLKQESSKEDLSFRCHEQDHNCEQNSAKYEGHWMYEGGVVRVVHLQAVEQRLVTRV